VTQDFDLGFWSGSYFGGALQYEDGWSGRYYSTKSELITLGAGINGAYKVKDWLSIGAGPFFLYGKLDQRVAVNNVLDGGPDGISSSRTASPASAAWLGSCSSRGTANA
jgi:long-subunit fatty acid transport protein